MLVVYALVTPAGEMLTGLDALDVFDLNEDGNGFVFTDKQDCRAFLSLKSDEIKKVSRDLQCKRGLIFENNGPFYLTQIQ